MHDAFQLPLPRDPAVFEDLVCDVLSRQYRTYNLQRYGRSGQEQRGVDVVGVAIAGVAVDQIIGAQCKHTPGGLTKKIIQSEVEKAEKFQPSLDRYIIATTSPRDTQVQDFVTSLSQKRVTEEKFPIEVLFWDDLCSKISNYPDLLYKYFSRHYPQIERLSIILPGINTPTPPKVTCRWPATVQDMERATSQTLASIPPGSEAPITIGVTQFNLAMDGLVDLFVQLDGNDFTHFAQTFQEVKHVVQQMGALKHLTVFANVRLSTAVLLGWVFRSVAGIRLSVVAGSTEELWTTHDVPMIRSGISDELPHLLDSTSREVVVVLNISRNLQQTVIEFVGTWQHQPRAIIGYTLQGGVQNTAHAGSIAREISDRLKQIDDNWQATRIHLFAAMPAALAVLIGHHLNRLCPIDIYYNQKGSAYSVGGTLSDQLEEKHGTD